MLTTTLRLILINKQTYVTDTHVACLLINQFSRVFLIYLIIYIFRWWFISVNELYPTTNYNMMQQHTYIWRTTTYLHRNCPKIGFHLRPTIFSQNNFSSNICRETIHFETRLWSIDASKGTASCHYINNDELSCVHSMRCRWKQNGAHHPRDQKFLGHVISQLQVYIGTSGVGVGILDRHLWSSSDGTGSLMKYQEGGGGDQLKPIEMSSKIIWNESKK